MPSPRLMLAAADDRLTGGPGDDRLFGDNRLLLGDTTEGQLGVATGRGSDSISGGAGEDVLYGDHFAQSPPAPRREGGADRILAGPDRDRIFSGPRPDRCDGGGGKNADGGRGGVGGSQRYSPCDVRRRIP